MTKKRWWLLFVVWLTPALIVGVILTAWLGPHPQSKEETFVYLHGPDFTRQPIPTYKIEIRGPKGSVVRYEGTYQPPEGKQSQFFNKHAELPANIYVNADCSVDLRIETDGDAKFTATVFYEFQEVKKWLATAKGIRGGGVTFNLKPYEEGK